MFNLLQIFFYIHNKGTINVLQGGGGGGQRSMVKDHIFTFLFFWTLPLSDALLFRLQLPHSDFLCLTSDINYSVFYSAVAINCLIAVF